MLKWTAGTFAVYIAVIALVVQMRDGQQRVTSTDSPIYKRHSVPSLSLHHAAGVSPNAQLLATYQPSDLAAVSKTAFAETMRVTAPGVSSMITTVHQHAVSLTTARAEFLPYGRIPFIGSRDGDAVFSVTLELKPHTKPLRLQLSADIERLDKTSAMLKTTATLRGDQPSVLAKGNGLTRDYSKSIVQTTTGALLVPPSTRAQTLEVWFYDAYDRTPAGGFLRRVRVYNL